MYASGRPKRRGGRGPSQVPRSVGWRVLLTRKSRASFKAHHGPQGPVHTRAMLDFGTKVVAGVTPGKADPNRRGAGFRQRFVKAVLRRKANASIIFVLRRTPRTGIEAIEAGSTHCHYHEADPVP